MEPAPPKDFADRLEAVLAMFVKGASADQVRGTLAGWKVPDPEVALLLATASDRFRKAGESVLDVERGKAVVQLLDLYAKCLRNTDYARALAIRKEMNVVLGLTGTAPKSAKKDAAAGAPDPLDEEIRRLEAELRVS